MDWPEFERFTQDILYEEPDIATSDLYGVSGGPTDRGADVIAHVRDSDQIDIGSCKCYEEATATKIKKWSDEFLNHWDSHWKHQNVRRFVLATAATNLSKRDIRDQIAEETRRFKNDFGLSYELWGPNSFKQKLRNLRALVSSYLNEAWAEAICGRAASGVIATKATSNILDASVVGQLAELQDKLSGQVTARADVAIGSLRAGDLEPAQGLVAELRLADEWSQLLPETRARIVRLEATLALINDELEDAKRLAGELAELPNEDENRLDAQIALREKDASSALAILGAPQTVAGKQLQAAILLDAGQVDESEKVINALLEDGSDDAETLRLQALLHLVNGDRGAALTTIQKAEELAGEWTAIIIAGAIVRYSQAISPIAETHWYMAPNPLDFALVKSDPHSQKQLLRAIQLFERWGKLEDRALDAKHWTLASLCNLVSRYDDASKLAAQLLRENPKDVTTIAWSVMRGLDVDLGPSFAAMKSEYLAGTDVFNVRALATMIASHPDFSSEVEVLKDGLDAQDGAAHREAELWWQRLGSVDEKEDITEETLELGDIIEHVRATGDHEALQQALADSFSGETPHTFALMAARFTAEQGQWHLLSEYLEKILAFDTADAVRLAAFVCANTEQPERALDLIENRAKAFGDSIPPDIQRLQAKLQLDLGQLKSALQHAGILGEPSKPISDQLISAQIRAQVGDLRGAAETVVEAYRQNALSPPEAWHWSQALALHDPEFAKELFNFGVSDGVEDPYAAASMNQAFRLGLDNMISRFMPQVSEQARSDNPSIRVADIDELVEMIKQQNEEQRHVEDLWLKGVIPTHAAVRGKVGHFANIYLSGSDQEPTPLSAKLVRHGGRQREIRYPIDWSDWRIHIDVSALFEAYNAGLLDLLARHPTPILISPRLPELLQRMEHEVVHHQPERVRTMSAVVALVDSGKISTSCPPDGAIHKVVLNSEEPKEAADWDALLSYVVANGFADESDVEGISGETAIAPTFDLAEGSTMHIDFAALEQLQRINGLEFLLSRYQLATDLTDVDQARHEINAARLGQETQGKLAKIREFVANGLLRNYIDTVPKSGPNEEPSDGILMESLADILGAQTINGGVVWIDDRMINGYANANSMPLVSVIEVLTALGAAKAISSEEKLDRIALLQSRGSAFVPFIADDVLGALRTAPIVSEQIIEVDQLKTARRYFAASRRLMQHTKVGDQDERLAGRPEETEAPSSYLRAVSNVLSSLWGDKSVDVSRCYAASDWVWFNLRLGQATHPQNWETAEKAQNYYEAMEIGQCLISAIGIGWITPSLLTEKREHFLNWLWQRAIEPKLQVDDHFLDRIADHLEAFYSGLLREYRRELRGRDLRFHEAVLSRQLGFLPDPIVEAIARREAFSRFYKARQAVTVGNHKFEPNKFWKAARSALIYGKARTRNDDGKIVRMRSENGDLLLGKPVYAKISDIVLPVLAAPKSAKTKALDKLMQSLELPVSIGRPYQERALAAFEPHIVAEIVHEATEASLIRHYATLPEKLKTNKSVGLDEFVPTSLDAMEHYLGIEPGEHGFDVKKAFNSLSCRLGEAEAIKRLTSLPVKLAGELDVRQDDLPNPIDETLTPVRYIQLLALRRENPEKFDANSEVEGLIGNIDQFGTLFTAILKWVWNWSFREENWRLLDHERRVLLVWAHASKLAEAFMHANSHTAKVQKHFEENWFQLQTSDLCVSNRVVPFDHAAPRWMSNATLLFHGLAEIFGDDDVGDIVSDDLANAVRERLTVKAGEVISPAVELMIRMGAQSKNSSSEFLNNAPRGVLPENLCPQTTISSVIDRALTDLENELLSPDAWKQLAAFCPSGLTDAQWERAKSLIEKAGLWNLPIAVGEMRFAIWRALLTPLIIRDWEKAAEELTVLARHGRETYSGRINSEGDDTAKAGHAAVVELVEAAALIASEGGTEAFDDRFKHMLWSVASVWPESVPMLRSVVRELALQTMTRRSEALDELYTYLRTFP